MLLRIELGKISDSFNSSSPPRLCLRCFPHIVNLACQAALGAITDVGEEPLPEYESYDGKDCIVTISALTNAVIPIFFGCYHLIIINWYRFKTATSRDNAFQNM